MIAEAFAYATLVALLVGLGAASTERMLAEIKRPRRFAWLGAYLVALAFPLLSMLLVADAPEPFAARLDVTSREAAAVYSEIDWNTLLLSLWAAATTLLLLLYSAAHLRLRLLAKRWSRASSETASVVVADDIGPAVLGVLTPRIVLPRWLLDAPATVRSAVMAHELEHIVARDQALIVAAQLITILLPWNLPLWWFARRIRAAIEIDCDARVLRGGVDAAHYADVLLAVGQRRSQSPYLAATLIEPVTQLERRIRIMLKRPSRISKTRAAIAFALAVAIAACTTRLEAPSLPTSPTAAPAEVVIESNGIQIASRTIDVRGPGVALAPGVTSDTEVTLLSGDVVLRATPIAGVGRSQMLTSSRVTKTDDGILLEGDVRLDLDRMSITTPRAFVRTTPDGSTRIEMDSAALTYTE
jgi:bla regulator protein blaR1